MDTEKELDEINKEICDRELKELQYKHRLKREQAKAAYLKRLSSPEYKARTHRLCDKGGTVEHFYPDTKELTSEEFYELIDTLDHDLLIRDRWQKTAKEILDRRREVVT